MYEWWHAVLLVFFTLGVGLRVGFLIGRDHRTTGHDSRNPRAPQSVPMTPEIRERLQAIAAASPAPRTPTDNG